MSTDLYHDAMTLRAPFPWFGGKSRVAHLVWERFGDVPNYVEPFAGSLAVLLARPTAPGTETVNDRDCYLSNFWRAVKADPEAVAKWADWLPNEADLRARHEHLRLRREGFDALIQSDPNYFDAQMAGFWVYGAALSLGNTWQRATKQQVAIGKAGGGGLGQTVIAALAGRLRNVRVLSGDWSRAVSDVRLDGLTGVFLDPPYAVDAHAVSYAEDTSSSDVRSWAIENGDNPALRIALCGYEGEHEMPATWAEVAWKARGGYGSRGDGPGRENAQRERIWFSPACLDPAAREWKPMRFDFL